MGEKFLSVVQSKYVIFAYILICFLSVFLFLQIDTKASAYFTEKDHPSRVIEREMGEHFTRTEDTTLITLSANESVFNKTWVDLITKIHARLESILVNDRPAYKSVKSLLNTEFIKDDEGDILIEPVYIEKHWTETEVSEITKSQLMKGFMVSGDGKSLNIYGEIGYDIEDGVTNKSVQALTRKFINEEIEASGLKIETLYGGVSVINNEMLGVMEHDLGVFIPGVVAVTFLLLSLFLGFVPAVICILVSVISILMTMSVMRILGYEINVITNTLPIFIITIAVTDAIHLLSKSQNTDSVKSKIKRLFRPMLFTSITTCVGFLALSYTEIENVKQLGILVAVGIVLALVVTWTIVPALKQSIEKQRRSRINMARMITEKNILIGGAIVAALIIAVSGAGIKEVVINQGGLSSFNIDTEIRIDNKKMSTLGTGAIPMSVWIRHDENALSGQVLKAIKEIQAIEHNHIVTTTSIVDYLERIHNVFGEKTSLNLNDTALIEQYMILLEGGSERDIETVFDVITRQDTRAILMTDYDDSVISEEIESEIRKVLSINGIESYEIIGYGSLNIDAAEDIWSAQVSSMIISVVIILGLLIALYRSLWQGLIAILPLIATLLVMFGSMGILRIPIDVGSSIVASICIGMGIDYSIHIMEAMKRTKTATEAVLDVLKPIGTSAIVLSCGFSVLYLSNFFPLRSLGILISIAMLASAITALLIIPTIVILRERILRARERRELA